MPDPRVLDELAKELTEGQEEFCSAIEMLVGAHVGLTTGNCDLDMYEYAQKRLRLALIRALREKGE